MENEAAKEFARQFSDFVNGSRSRTVEAAKLCLNDHPTLQQGMMRFCIAFIEGMAVNRGDLRNQAARDFAKKVMAATDSSDRAMPLI